MISRPVRPARSCQRFNSRWTAALSRAIYRLRSTPASHGPVSGNSCGIAGALETDPVAGPSSFRSAVRGAAPWPTGRDCRGSTTRNTLLQEHITPLPICQSPAPRVLKHGWNSVACPKRPLDSEPTLTYAGSLCQQAPVVGVEAGPA
jgi:hypothetical protein